MIARAPNDQGETKEVAAGKLIKAREKGDIRGITASKVGQDDSKDPNKNGDIEDPTGEGKPAEILQAVKPNKQGQQIRGSGKRPKKGILESGGQKKDTLIDQVTGRKKPPPKYLVLMSPPVHRG